MQVSGSEGNMNASDDQQNANVPGSDGGGDNLGNTDNNAGAANNQNDASATASGLTPKMLTKAAALVGKTLLLTTSSSNIEAELRESIKKAKQGQLQASQRELEGAQSPEGEDVESWVKLVRKLNNKLDKHMTANESLSKTLEEHADLLRKFADQLVELSKSYE